MRADWAVTLQGAIRRSRFAIMLFFALAISGCDGARGVDVQPLPDAEKVGQPLQISAGTTPGSEPQLQPLSGATQAEDGATTEAWIETLVKTPETSASNLELNPNPEKDANTGGESTTSDSESTLALTGLVAAYLDAINGEGAGIVSSSGSDDVSAASSKGLFLDDERAHNQFLSRGDLLSVQALVSMFLLADVDYQLPVATVMTDDVGNYSVTGDDRNLLNLAYEAVGLAIVSAATASDLLEFHNLNYGDWLVLDNPSGYHGAQVLPPEVLAVESFESYKVLGQAIDGVIVRFAGDHFAENIKTTEDIEAVFGSPPDFSSVPVCLEAGRDGVTFVKLTFDQIGKRYVMDPLPQDAIRSTTQLSHNDLIAIFDDQSENDAPVYIARAVLARTDVARSNVDSLVRELPASESAFEPLAAGQLALEVLRLDMLQNEFSDYDEREVVCIMEEDGLCSVHYPSLYSAIDAVNAIGIVYDNDVDGLPFLFDVNDFDPNIPSSIAEPDVGVKE